MTLTNEVTQLDIINEVENTPHKSIMSTTKKAFTIGASGSEYSAPADGYFLIKANVTDGNQGYTVATVTYDGIVYQLTTGSKSSWGTSQGHMLIPISKGNKIKVDYQSNITLIINFYYTEGNKSEFTN